MLVSLTVGKVDAGVAVLLTEDKRLIEFPSILLPPDIHSGSIVDINVSRNQHAELIADQKFAALQSEIFQTFGIRSPSAPVLRCRNATQTSVVLEWDPIELATAELRSLSLYRNGAKAGNIPLGKLSTKISGLALDTAYTFHLVLRTSAGQYSSEKVVVKTHKMTDLHGITITPGIMPAQLKDSLVETVHKIGAKIIDQVRIDTTHFVCTEPRGQAWEKAVEMNVPVVVPDWIKGCEREGRIVGVRAYYLDADPSKRTMGPSAVQQAYEGQPRSGSVSTVQMRDSPRIEHTPPTPEQPKPQRGLPQQNGQEASTRPEVVSGERNDASSSLAGTTIAEQVAAKEEDEHEEDDKDEEDEEELDEQTRHDAALATEHPQAEKEEEKDERRTEPANAAEEDGKFDEVAL